MVSIVIPAHDEEGVITRCLTSILEGAKPSEFEIVVVCNGCRDRTAELAREFDEARVIETETPAKWNALNVGDAAATRYPRFYVDADVEISAAAIREVARAMGEAGRPSAAPRAVVDYARATWPVRAYYSFWMQTAPVEEGMVGCGVYALSRSGRERVGEIPDIIADDAYVRASFAPKERLKVESAEVVVKAPLRSGDLIRTRTRSRLGLYELSRRFPALAGGGNEGGRLRRSANTLFRPSVWPALSVYVIFSAITRIRALRQLTALDSYKWERDESTRTGENVGA